MCAQMSAA